MLYYFSYSSLFDSQPVAKIAEMREIDILYEHIILFFICSMPSLLNRNLASYSI